MAAKGMEQRRGRGRPRQRVSTGEGDEVLSRQKVIETAREMSKTMRLDDVSFVQIGRILGATPGSIHYYAGTRAQLTSTVINGLYKQVVEGMLGIQEDNWKKHLKRTIELLHRALLEYPGVASYLATQAPFRIFQHSDIGEPDYGRLYLDKILLILKNAGFSPRYAGQIIHLIHGHVLVSSYGELEGTLPRFSADQVKKRWESEKKASQPLEGIVYGLGGMAQLDLEAAFEEGVDALMDRFAKHLKKHKSKSDK